MSGLRIVGTHVFGLLIRPKHYIIMFQLRLGYALSGIATGLVLLWSFLWSLPDGKLHITFCNVGQGDAAYILFPDGRDMLVDGGPRKSVLECLGRHMPFWDRNIDLVLMTHPQADHAAGLSHVFERYRIGSFLRSDISGLPEVTDPIDRTVEAGSIPVRFIGLGSEIMVGDVRLTFIWPVTGRISSNRRASLAYQNQEIPDVLGTGDDLNDYSAVMMLSYGTFEAVFTGDADLRVNHAITLPGGHNYPIEVLKVPHHGSRNALSDEFLSVVSPELAVISVGKNTYGHPAPETVRQLEDSGVRVRQTDQGDINIISDGLNWKSP